MKKYILALVLSLLSSFPAFPDGNVSPQWEVLSGAQRCDVQVVYDSGAKLSVARELAADGVHSLLIAEWKSWHYPLQSTDKLLVRVLDLEGKAIFSQNVPVSTGKSLQEVRYKIDDVKFTDSLWNADKIEITVPSGTGHTVAYPAGPDFRNAFTKSNAECITALAKAEPAPAKTDEAKQPAKKDEPTESESTAESKSGKFSSFWLVIIVAGAWVVYEVFKSN